MSEQLELLEESIPSLLDDEGQEIPTIEVDDDTLKQSKPHQCHSLTHSDVVHYIYLRVSLIPKVAPLSGSFTCRIRTSHERDRG